MQEGAEGCLSAEAVECRRGEAGRPPSRPCSASGFQASRTVSRVNGGGRFSALVWWF